MAELQVLQDQLNITQAQKVILDNRYAIDCANNADQQANLQNQITAIQQAAALAAQTPPAPTPDPTPAPSADTTPPTGTGR